MVQVRLSSRFTKGFISESEIVEQIPKVESARQLLHNKTGKGSEFLGWVDLPSKISQKEIQDIEDTVKKIQDSSEFLIVVGIGGSYLGARAVIEASLSSFTPYVKTNGVKILYAGHHIDSDYHSELLSFLADRDFSVNVISKSGTTTEPALAFRSLYSLLVKKYGEQKANQRVIATTDAARGALKKFSDEKGFRTFVIPDDVGGRYSVLTPVGLLPIAVAGLNINELIAGARQMQTELSSKTGRENIACMYAALRNLLYQKGKKIEILVNYNPRLQYFIEWWKQLYGESEGKDKKGIFPAGVNFTTDLHSMGQYIQDGERILFETVLEIQKPNLEVLVEEFAGDLDGLNYLTGKSLHYINSKAIEGTKLAHLEGGVSSIVVEIDSLNLNTLGQLIYFFEYACGISGYTLGVNPFDQPGVEDYKNNMFALLGKKGYEQKKSIVEQKLSQL